MFLSISELGSCQESILQPLTPQCLHALNLRVSSYHHHPSNLKLYREPRKPPPSLPSINTHTPKQFLVINSHYNFFKAKIVTVSISANRKSSLMVDIDIQIIPSAFDPFGEAKESGAPGAKEYVHIRIQQRNGKKSLTTVQGLRKEFSYDKILKDLKKDFCCNGNVVVDKELGKVIQLQGDQRKKVSQFLINAGIVKKDQIKIHGF